MIQRFTSPDGTSIACRREGSGPPLVMVHGTSGSADRWESVLPVLGERFTVYALNRRGTGASGDAEPYAIEREFEDIAAVVDALEGPVHLLGHSFGGICALEAALLTPNLDKLILYEGAPIDGATLPGDLLDRMETLLDAGQREELLVTFLEEIAGLSPIEIEQSCALPSWKDRAASAHTLPREFRAVESYVFEPQRFANLPTPTLLMVGGDSPPFAARATERLHALLPNSRIAVLPGQTHIAYHTAPDLFAGEVLAFLQAPG